MLSVVFFYLLTKGKKPKRIKSFFIKYTETKKLPDCHLRHCNTEGLGDVLCMITNLINSCYAMSHEAS